MSAEDKAGHDGLIRRLKTRDLPMKDRGAAPHALDDLVRRYGG